MSDEQEKATNDNRVTVTVTVQASPSRELPVWTWALLVGLGVAVLAVPHMPPAAGQALAHLLGQLADHAPR